MIVIPSVSRWDNQITMANLPDGCDISLAIRENQYQEYARRYPNTTTLITPSGIGATRQTIIDWVSESVIMMDDDLTFAVRREDEPDKFIPANGIQVALAIRQIYDYLKEYAFCGMASREGGNRNVEPIRYNTRALRVLAYRADVLRKEGIRFDRVPVMEDFDVALQLLRKGYQMPILNWIVHDQKGSNTAGGCSTYRTPEVQEEGAKKLAELHPEFVTVVKKKTKVAWGGQERFDVRIQWKRAFESAGTVRVLD